MSRNKNVHLTGLAITLDSQQRVATAQKQWVGQLACFDIALASSQLAPQAVAGVHDRHITAGHREFDRRLYLFHPMVAIQLIATSLRIQSTGLRLLMPQVPR